MLKFVTMVNDEAVDSKYQREHGLSFYIGYEKAVYLFDTGQSDKIINNLSAHHLKIKAIDHTILSHGHYDHAGGLKPLLAAGLKGKFYVGHGFWEAKYSISNHDYIFKGIDVKKEAIQAAELEEIKIEKSLAIAKNVYILTDFTRDSSFENIDKKFKVLRNHEMVADKFQDEIVLCIDDQVGLIVFVGCSHPGIVNILESVKKHFNKDIYAVFGGFHLVNEEEAYINEVIKYLKENVQVMGAGHCTGDLVVSSLKAHYKDKYLPITVGKEHILI